jgi:hypothetical protein
MPVDLSARENVCTAIFTIRTCAYKC